MVMRHNAGRGGIDIKERRYVGKALRKEAFSKKASDRVANVVIICLIAFLSLRPHRLDLLQLHAATTSKQNTCPKYRRVYALSFIEKTPLLIERAA